jgi:hypothetical protein
MRTNRKKQKGNKKDISTQKEERELVLDSVFLKSVEEVDFNYRHAS